MRKRTDETPEEKDERDGGTADTERREAGRPERAAPGAGGESKAEYEETIEKAVEEIHG
jgi:hypothetical protein